MSTPRRDWAKATAAAEANYTAGVQAAAAKGRFGAGVRKAGSGKWAKGIQEKGSQRFAAGVAMAGQAYQEGYGPYHQVISALQLPARYARRDPRNLQRVTAIATALGAKKEQTAK